MPNFLAWDEKKLERYFNALYDGDFNNKRLPPELYEAILDKLTQGIAEGFGDFEPGSQKAKVFTGLVDNVAVFSAAKTYQQINDMQNFLFDSKGFKRPFKEFKEAATEIFDTYNDNWLKTEYNTAIGQSRSASNWADYERDKEALPMLKYSTVGDGRVRDEHRDLDGIIKPVGDPFWNTNAPLNGFGCRCILIQLEEGEETDLDKLEKELGRPIDKPNKLFRYNPGKEGLIFDEGVHPYFKVDKRYKIGKKGGGVAVKQPPRKPPVTKIKQPPKVVPTSVAPAVFATKKAAKDFLFKSIETNSKLKVKGVTIASELSVEDITKRVSTLDNLFKEYNLASSTAATYEKTKIVFRSTKRYYGVVKSGTYLTDGTRFIREINLGHQSDGFSARKYVKGAIGSRSKSRVDEINLDIATTTHEFAHVISVQRVKTQGAASKADIQFFDDLKELQNNYYKDLNNISELDRNEIYLGRYAGTNLNEFMAEGFTEYKLSSNPTPYATKIGKLIDKYYKK
jgi:SPP1 gp7 family putative phage head morphogenesis protein